MHIGLGRFVFWTLLALFCTTSAAAKEREFNFSFQKNRLPEFRFEPAPIPIDALNACAFFIQGGPLSFRSNATYGHQLDEQHFLKFSGEYLTQKLGFNFDHGKAHRWVLQGACGASYRYLACSDWLEYIDAGLIYSHSWGRQLHIKMSRIVNVIDQRRIAGANAVSMNVNGGFCLWETGLIELRGFYDYAHFHKKYASSPTLSGLGAGISFTQNLFMFGTLQLGADFRRPYNYFFATYSAPILAFDQNTALAVFAERTIGRDRVASSSRIGISLELSFGPMRRCSDQTCTTSCALLDFVARPAVYMPEVLAMSDDGISPMCSSPAVAELFGTVSVPAGQFRFDASSGFTGSDPLIFSGTGLPPGFKINALSGMITGNADGSQQGTYTASIKAINSCGTAAQTVIFQFFTN